jgi:hypothetical protein
MGKRPASKNRDAPDGEEPTDARPSAVPFLTTVSCFRAAKAATTGAGGLKYGNGSLSKMLSGHGRPAMNVTLQQIPVTRRRPRSARRVLLFLLLLIVMEDAVDLLNSGAFAWTGEEYVDQGRRPPLTQSTRIVADEVRGAYRTTAIMRQAAGADNVGRRRDPIPSHTRAPRARSHIVSPLEDVSAPVPQ